MCGLEAILGSETKTKKSGEQERVALAKRGVVEVGNSQSQGGLLGTGRCFIPDLHGYYNNCLSYTSAWLFSVLSYDKCTSFPLSFPS